MTADHFRAALGEKSTPRTLHSFTPEPGDCVFLEAGTVHAIGANILLFEVQQTSDITYRLYDWDRVDAKTGQPRQLHVDEGLACADFRRGPCPPVGARWPRSRGGAPRRKLVDCRYFTLERQDQPRALPRRAPRTSAGRWFVWTVRARSSGGPALSLATGDTILLPAEVGECAACRVGRSWCWSAGCRT